MNVFDLGASLKLDSSEYDKGLDNAEHKGEGFTKKLASGLGNAAKAAGVAIGAAATAVGALATASVKNFADYEQLVGGVQKLYGNAGQSLKEYAKTTGQTVEQAKGDYKKLEKAQNLVLDNASQAYKTAGMDMNTYMENATSFSAALINSLGGDTVKAAKQTDVAMRAISDNVNTFGSDMESVTTAFMGFSKQNYTMLDNLKLGYGGTKSEMERLIDDANKWGKANGEASNLSINSFSDVVTAIEQIQKAQGIAGTTQREAASTISGSIEMTKAAWSNLLTAFSDPEQDIGAKIDQLVESAGAAFGNLVPVIEQSLQGIGQFVEKIAPMISEKLPAVVQTVLPSLLSAATSLVSGLVTALPSIILVIVQQIPMLMNSIITAIQTTAPSFLDAGKKLIQMLGDGIKSAAGIVQKNGDNIIDKVLNTITKNLPKFLDNGVKLITNLANGLLNALPTVITKAGEIMSKLISFIIKNAPTMAEKGVDLIVKLAQGLVRALPNIVSSAMQVTAKLIQQILQALPQLIEAGFKLIGKLAAGVIKGIPDAIKAFISMRDRAKETISSFDWLSLGTNIVKGIISGLTSMGSAVITAMLDLAKGAFNAVKNFFGIKSPSKKMRDEIGHNIVDGMIKGIDDKKENAKKSAEQLSSIYVSTAKTKLSALKENNRISLEEEVAYWLEVREHVKKGTKAYDEATAQIGKAKKAYAENAKKEREELVKNVNDLNKEYMDGVKKVIEDLDAQTKALTDAYNKAVEDRKNSLMGQMSLFETFTPKEGKAGQDLITGMESQMKAMAEYDSTMTTLQSRIGETAPALYGELQNMNVDQIETLKTIAAMSDEELQYYVGLYNAKQMFAEDRAKRDNEELKKQTDEQIEELKKNANDQLNTLEETYKTGIKKIGKMGEKEFKKAGKQSIKGMGIGMNTEFDALEKQMKARAEALVAAVQAALRIHSPSRVFADEVGKFIPLGIAEGVEKAMPTAERSILSDIEDMKNAAVDVVGSGYTSSMGAGASSSPVIMVLTAIYDAIMGMPDDMTQSFGDALTNTTFSMNDREFARLVKAV